MLPHTIPTTSLGYKLHYPITNQYLTKLSAFSKVTQAYVMVPGFNIRPIWLKSLSLLVPPPCEVHILPKSSPLSHRSDQTAK